MAHQFRVWRAPLRVLALVVAVVVIPLPGLAADASQPTAPPGLRASIARIAASTPLNAPPGTPKASARHSEETGQTGQAELGSPSFFRTPVGVAVIAVVGAGAAYAVYSAKHDRIRSPSR